ncbi:hypothetical protein HPB47_007814 [Ixodes persulcatus]|uniref:Uncharacterized protein n=1 Tax=Ixodes persulcatus TaxID=34615 RepID=A0AC60P7C7_IXOPE|nr:hypothetical protein HPB47_007814 [Ixodes persulcatus]
MLTWAEIDDLVTLNVRPQLRSYFTLDELEYKMRCSRESELLRYRSRHGLLDIGNAEATLFKQQFRFEKLDFDELSSSLLIPQTITTAVRQAVEWGFGKVVAEFTFLDFKKNQKLLWQQVEEMYKVGTIFTNCHTIIYGTQVSTYFGLDPPPLREYLEPHNV